jgi:hypothetical protein
MNSKLRNPNVRYKVVPSSFAGYWCLFDELSKHIVYRSQNWSSTRTDAVKRNIEHRAEQKLVASVS